MKTKKNKKIKGKKVNKALLNFSTISNLKIKTKLMTAFIILSTVPLAIMGFSTYSQAKNAISYEVGNFSGELIKQIGTNIDLKLSAIQDSSGCFNKYAYCKKYCNTYTNVNEINERGRTR